MSTLKEDAMIICITVEDNDFTSYLENFADKLLVRLFFNKPKNFEALSNDKKVAFYEKKEQIKNIVSREIFEKLSDKELSELRTEVFSEWISYLQDLDIKDDTKNYLIDNFDVSITFHFTDKWENGEKVYYFTTNQKWIRQ